MLKPKSAIACLALGFAALLSCGGCGGAPNTISRTNFVEFTPEQRLAIEADAGKHYQIQEGDILRVAFSYEKDLTQDGVVVLSDGAVSLIGVDRLVVAGKSLTEVDSLVTQAYAADYLEPELSIIVQETQGRKIYVLGEVKNPGMHRLPSGGIDILGAISIAGGFNGDAAKSGTVLVRVTDAGYLVQEIDMSDVSSVASIGLAMVKVEPFDVVYVPRSRAGDFGYFTKSILSGIGQITRIATDMKYLSNGGLVRF